jgi:hypothetical protein
MQEDEDDQDGAESMITIASWSPVGVAVRRLLGSLRPSTIALIDETGRLKGLLSAADLAWALRIHGPALWPKPLRELARTRNHMPTGATGRGVLGRANQSFPAPPPTSLGCSDI